MKVCCSSSENLQVLVNTAGIPIFYPSIRPCPSWLGGVARGCRWRPKTAASGTLSRMHSHGIEGLLQVGDDVFDVFGADGQPDEVGRDAGGLLLFGGQLLVRRAVAGG